MSDSFDITTVIFAVLALFVLFKLRSVLGTRNGNERLRDNPFSRKGSDTAGAVRASSKPDNVIRLPEPASSPLSESGKELAVRKWGKFASEKAWNGLDEIASREAGFDAPSFIDGARSAYEMIVSAFASGDRKTLRELLANDVFENFRTAIEAREGRGEKVETSFVSIEKCLIEEAQVRGTVAQVTVRFNSKLITCTRDSSNQLVEGNPEKIVDITDIWTFSRDLNSRDPNWRLIATETGN